MRRSRRGGHSGMEFGGSGEDSFVAVVVTKLTGALLFILLLTMVIMALIPKAIDLPSSPARDAAAESEDDGAGPLRIGTPGTLPEAIAGRPYQVALAAIGGRGPLRWSIDGPLPAGLSLDPESGLVRGTPERGTPEPSSLVLRVDDGKARASQSTQLVVYQPDRPLTVPSKWKPALPPIPWRAWLDQGFGFLVLVLVHMVGMNAIASLERRARAADPEAAPGTHRRFVAYRATLRLASVAAFAGLVAWLWAAPA
ncbi:Ig domain-containing protein [Tundrisphaera sp. TA3]|uniref:Ig domain-containing protein n=1 Tax=Tundrisphaera sp. TA3 TaxID=3435775 RepID=UPI003EB8FD7B